MLKRKIVENLESIKYEDNSKIKYQSILSFIRQEEGITLTKTRSGYWFDLTPVPEDTARRLYDKIRTVCSNNGDVDQTRETEVAENPD